MSDEPMPHAIGDQLIKDKVLREIGDLPKDVLQKIAAQARVEHARQTLEAAGYEAAEDVAVAPAVKSGLKTSEGWLSYIISILGGIIAAWGASKNNELISMIGSALAGGTTVGYTFARMKAKKQ